MNAEQVRQEEFVNHPGHGVECRLKQVVIADPWGSSSDGYRCFSTGSHCQFRGETCMARLRQHDANPPYIFPFDCKDKVPGADYHEAIHKAFAEFCMPLRSLEGGKVLKATTDCGHVYVFENESLGIKSGFVLQQGGTA